MSELRVLTYVRLSAKATGDEQGLLHVQTDCWNSVFHFCPTSQAEITTYLFQIDLIAESFDIFTT